MDFLEAMQSRYTTKAYDAEYSIPQEQIEALKEILRLSPSSINSQPWSFSIVGASALKEQFAEASLFNKEKVERASHIAVFSVYADVATFESERLSHLHQYAQDYYNASRESRGEGAIRSWLEHQVYIALGVFLSACATMGIDSTPMEGIDTTRYTELMGNDKYRVLFAVAIGKRASDDPNRLEVTPKNRRTDSII